MLDYIAFALLAVSVATAIALFVLWLRGWRKPFLFYAGVAYILVGLPNLAGWLLYIAIPMILVGIVFIFLSRIQMRTVAQIVLSLLPLAIVFGYGSYAGTSKNIFLIPEGYTGRIVIIHGCKDGAPKEFDGFTRIYKIPPNGILKTQFHFAGTAFDALNSHFFYVDNSGKKTPLNGDPANPAGRPTMLALWSLPHEQHGDTIIDFIIEKTKIEDSANYRAEETPRYQREIDSCRTDQ